MFRFFGKCRFNCEIVFDCGYVVLYLLVVDEAGGTRIFVSVWWGFVFLILVILMGVF